MKPDLLAQHDNFPLRFPFSHLAKLSCNIILTALPLHTHRTSHFSSNRRSTTHGLMHKKAHFGRGSLIIARHATVLKSYIGNIG